MTKFTVGELVSVVWDNGCHRGCCDTYEDGIVASVEHRPSGVGYNVVVEGGKVVWFSEFSSNYSVGDRLEKK